MRRSREETLTFLEAKAREMRRWPTLAEKRLWLVLRPLGFKSQCPIAAEGKNGGTWLYILDFYSPTAGLCIEVDGGYHKRHKGRDRRRDARLKTAGIRTIRLSNEYVLGATLAELRARVEKEMGEA